MNRISKMLLAFTACALCVAPAIAQDGTLKKIKDNGTITIGHRDASMPFSYYDDKQQPVGYRDGPVREASSTRSRPS